MVMARLITMSLCSWWCKSKRWTCEWIYGPVVVGQYIQKNRGRSKWMYGFGQPERLAIKTLVSDCLTSGITSVWVDAWLDRHVCVSRREQCTKPEKRIWKCQEAEKKEMYRNLTIGLCDSYTHVCVLLDKGEERWFLTRHISYLILLNSHLRCHLLSLLILI